MSNPTAYEWEQKITTDGISTLEVWAMVGQMKRLEQRIRELEEQQSTLTEQLRLANEDAERLAEYVGHKRTCTWLVTRSDVTPRCGCKLSDVMYLHKKRITQESE